MAVTGLCGADFVLGVADLGTDVPGVFEEPRACGGLYDDEMDLHTEA